MSVTEQYIDLIIPSLSGSDSESLSIFKTEFTDPVLISTIRSLPLFKVK